MSAVRNPQPDLAVHRTSRQELERRWSLVRARLAEDKLEAVIVLSSEDYLGANVRWLTDRAAVNAYHRAVVLPADDLMTIVEHGNLAGRRQSTGDEPDYPGVGEIFTTAAFHSVSYTQRFEGRILADILRTKGYRRLGIADRDVMPYGVVRSLESVPNVDITDLTEFFERARSLKSPEEIAQIRATATMQDSIFEELLGAITPGMRDMDVTAFLAAEGARRGSSQHVQLVGSASSEGVPALRPYSSQARVINRGDYLTVLIENNGPAGLYTELGRTIVLGRASQEHLDTLSIACAAQDDSTRRYVAGAACAELAAAHDQFRAKHHLPPEGRLFSHGQGYALVERPLIRADETMPLAAGMNIVTHPVFVRGNTFGFICDNYLVHSGGPAERLHRTERRLFEIDV